MVGYELYYFAVVFLALFCGALIYDSGVGTCGKSQYVVVRIVEFIVQLDYDLRSPGMFVEPMD
jgi:hypothetical protein